MATDAKSTGELERNGLARRDFLEIGLLTVGVAGLATLGDEASAAEKEKPTKRKLADVNHTHFEKYVGEKFLISRESKDYGKQVAIFTLTEAKHHKSISDKRRPSAVRSSGFSLLFRAETGEKLEDGIWQVDHPKIGTFDLFLHKTKRDKEPKRVFFVAVFN